MQAISCVFLRTGGPPIWLRRPGVPFREWFCMQSLEFSSGRGARQLGYAGLAGRFVCGFVGNLLRETGRQGRRKTASAATPSGTTTQEIAHKTTYETAPAIAQVFTSLLYFSTVFTSLHQFSLVCTSFHLFSQVCTSFHKFSQVCTSFRKFAQIFTSFHKFAQVFASFHQFATIFTS